ncbi:HEPN domain-containing protein [Saccharopolyspora karakumensis]|uniref:HEPN domain-containing protein n=1 Tax=Saccharopolyspora karakumensis TaxID=2530386 RepID=UPI0038B42749
MKSTLDAIYERYERSLRVVPIDLQQDLHLYICIRLSGYLEQLLHQAISAYVAETSGQATSNFALSWFRKAPNLTPKSLEALIERFGDEWIADLKELLEKESNRDSLGVLLKIRNDTAHGKSYGGSLAHVRTYKKLVDDIHTWVHNRFID